MLVFLNSESRVAHVSLMMKKGKIKKSIPGRIFCIEKELCKG